MHEMSIDVTLFSVPVVSCCVLFISSDPDLHHLNFLHFFFVHSLSLVIHFRSKQRAELAEANVLLLGQVGNDPLQSTHAARGRKSAQHATFATMQVGTKERTQQTNERGMKQKIGQQRLQMTDITNKTQTASMISEAISFCCFHSHSICGCFTDD